MFDFVWFGLLSYDFTEMISIQILSVIFCWVEDIGGSLKIKDSSDLGVLEDLGAPFSDLCASINLDTIGI